MEVVSKSKDLLRHANAAGSTAEQWVLSLGLGG